MIKHIVMWRLSESAHNNDKASNARLIKQKLENLRGKIPGLLNIEVGIDEFNTPDSSDVVLYSEFASYEALAVYQEHPEHKGILPFIAAARSERRVVDFTVEHGK